MLKSLMDWCVEVFNRDHLEKEPVVREPAPCGDDETHYDWKGKGWPCPVCHGRAKRRKELEEDERIARLNAKCLVEELKKQGIEIVNINTNSTLPKDGAKCIPKRVTFDE